MGNNRAFAGYVAFLVCGATLLIGSLIVAGIAGVPPLAKLLTDVALGLGIRAAYKQVGGWDWNEWTWSFAGDTPETVAAVAELPLRSADELQQAA